jgi:hypothetical protein
MCIVQHDVLKSHHMGNLGGFALSTKQMISTLQAQIGEVYGSDSLGAPRFHKLHRCVLKESKSSVR